MASQLQVTFGERVRVLRLAAGMTQDDLAKKTKIHRPDISDIENGLRSPTLDTVERIAKALKLPVAALFDESGTTCCMN